MKSPSSPRWLRRAVLRWLALGSALAVCGGCQALPSAGPPPLVFSLTPKSTFPPDLPTVDWQLLIDIPVAPAAINTAQIALQRTPLEIEYYARARWPDLAPIMTQTLIIESFENSEAIVAVGRDSVDLRADFVLKTDLREFQAEYFHGDRPLVRVAFLARLVMMPRRTIVGLRRFEATQPAAENRLTEIVHAFDDALGSVLKDLVVWSLRTGEAARAARTK